MPSGVGAAGDGDRRPAEHVEHVGQPAHRAWSRPPSGCRQRRRCCVPIVGGVNACVGVAIRSMPSAAQPLARSRPGSRAGTAARRRRLDGVAAATRPPGRGRRPAPRSVATLGPERADGGALLRQVEGALAQLRIGPAQVNLDQQWRPPRAARSTAARTRRGDVRLGVLEEVALGDADRHSRDAPAQRVAVALDGHRRRACDRVATRRPAAPAVSAQSRTERAIGPQWSSVGQSGWIPARLTRPNVGFSPTMPQHRGGAADRAAGVRPRAPARRCPPRRRRRSRRSSRRASARCRGGCGRCRTRGCR